MIRNFWLAPVLCVALALSAIAADQAQDRTPAVSQQLSLQPAPTGALRLVADRDPLPLTPHAGWRQVKSNAGTKGDRRPIWAHLASYRSRARALKGWAELRRSHYPLLEGCAAHVARSAPKKGKGVYYRLGCAGLTNLDEGRWLCAQLRKDGQYCMPLRMAR